MELSNDEIVINMIAGYIKTQTWVRPFLSLCRYIFHDLMCRAIKSNGLCYISLYSRVCCFMSDDDGRRQPHVIVNSHAKLYATR